MKCVHVRNIEKYQPGYKDRRNHYAKVYLAMIQGDPEAENLGEVEFARLVKFVVLETCNLRPTPIDKKYLSKRNFDFGLQDLDQTLAMLSHFIEIVDVTETYTHDAATVTIPYTHDHILEERRGEERTCVTELEIPPKDPSPSPQVPRPPSPSGKATTQGFDRFWRAYPKKKSKGDAERAWKKLQPDEPLQDSILDAIERARTSAEWKKDGGQYIPYPATWLNAKGWEDEYESKPRGRQFLKVLD